MAEQSRIVGGGTKSVEANDLFLKGRELMLGLKKDREIFDRWMACFRRAIELDPNYSDAYAGLSMSYCLDHENRGSDQPELSLGEAERFADAAIAKDDKNPYAHFAASMVAMNKKDYRRWMDESEKALSLHPNYAPATVGRGTVYIYTGEPAKAIPTSSGRCVSIPRSLRNTCISLAQRISWPATMDPPRKCSRIA